MRIMYWNTSCLEPEIEAVSKEIFKISNYFKNSFIFGISDHYTFRYSSKDRYIGLSAKFDPFLRLLIPIIERRCDINHVYGEPCPWIFYKTLKRKPLLLTVASEKGMLRSDFLAHCRKIIVQTATFREKLLALGIERDKVELAYPAVELDTFKPSAPGLPLNGSPKVLFATAPRSEEEMLGRGVHLLLQAAKLSPDVHYRLLYRKWRTGYTSLKATKDVILNHKLTNVLLTNDACSDMPSIYNAHHFTVVPYTTSDGGKECPNSLIEGLACGLPALVSSVTPLSYFVDEQQCGVVFEPKPSCLVEAIEIGLRRYRELSENAVRAARAYFAEDTLMHRLEKIYQEVKHHS